MKAIALRAIAAAFVLAALFAGSVSSSLATPIGGAGQVRYGVSKQKGFDACTAPSTSAMQTWWNFSPYWDIGIYIGGVNRACSQPNLTSSWASSAHNMGWSFYLTWVGLQAPCVNSPNSTFSSDPATAASQGQQAADNAVIAASNLGFDGTNVYYFDLEAYNTGDSTCRTAVKSFINGWSSRVQSYWGEKAGVYGSGCGSAVDDWASIGTPPNDVWIADWNLDPDVWGLCNVPNTHWTSDQRLHQYRGGHSETWGGVAISIDNDCADGQVVPHGHGTGGDPACYQE
jgi:hypothetical protein